MDLYIAHINGDGFIINFDTEIVYSFDYHTINNVFNKVDENTTLKLIPYSKEVSKKIIDRL